MNRSGILLLAAASFLLVLSLALYNGIETVKTDLTGQADKALEGEQREWVKLEIDGRDLHLSGEPPTEAAADQVLARLGELEGVHQVVDNLNRPPTDETATAKPDPNSAWSSAVQAN